MMKTLTVITTTYNRDYCLHQVYYSLCRQTSDDFLWLIIDDGSTDKTKELVDKWISEGKIEIEYYYKQNGGMHTARNLAYEKVHTELNVIIDSDDWMTDYAVEKIVSFWQKNGNERYSGIISNNITPEGKLSGSPIDINLHDCTLTDYFGKYGGYGDKKLIFRSELTKLYPYPEFQGEKFFPACYKFFLLDKDYTMLLMDEYTCVVDYNDDSMSNMSNKMRQYKTCCNGFAFSRNALIEISKSPKYIIKEMIHFIAECKFAKKNPITYSCRPLVAALCYPFGVIYYLLLNKKIKVIENG